MLTVRVIYPDSSERVIEAVSVIKEMHPSENTSDKIGLVRLFHTPDDSETIDEGNVYVMNGDGKTVATFILGAKMSETSG